MALLVLAGAVAAGASLLLPGAGASHAAAARQNGDELLIVDCLLPGQIRQLGGMVTYVSARRAIKTSAQDCEIRGGEYTAYDRASYATALKVWLPLAQDGKADAQNYVGEIFEKGLGVPPDFATAAIWYRKAADQGYSRAEINLGSLYERGLGVPKDPLQALNWYRRAAGASDLQFQAAPAAPTPAATPPAAANQPAANADRAREDKRQAAQQAELDRLRREVETLHRQLESKQDELNRTQQQLDQLRTNLQRRSDDAAGQRKQLAELRAELDAKRQSANADAAGIAQLEKNVADREAALHAKDKEVADLRASLASVAEKSRVQQANLEKLQKQSAAEPPSIQLIEPELAATRGQPTIKLPGPVESLVVVGRVETVPGLVSLTVNGREEKVDNQVFRSSVPVGDTEEHVRIVAVDRNGRKTTLEFVVPPRAKPAAPAATAMATQRAGTPRVGHPRPTEPVKFGSYHALIIGNDDYRFFKPLKTAIADAKEVARVLQQDYGFDVKLLIDAKRYDILSALNELRAKLTFNDNLLIYYAGHGELDEVNQRGNWLPVDAEPNSTANWISNISITDVLNAMNVRQLLIVADSCYSGTLTRAAVGHIEGGIDDAERVRLMQVMLQQHSRMALTSGGIEPVLDSVGGKHSAFAQAFIDVLKANVGVLPGQEMFQDLQSRVIAAADRFDQHQVPEYAPIKFAGHESGDFFFVRVANQ